MMVDEKVVRAITVAGIIVITAMILIPVFRQAQETARQAQREKVLRASKNIALLKQGGRMGRSDGADVYRRHRCFRDSGLHLQASQKEDRGKRVAKACIGNSEVHYSLIQAGGGFGMNNQYKCTCGNTHILSECQVAMLQREGDLIASCTQRSWPVLLVVNKQQQVEVYRPEGSKPALEELWNEVTCLA